MKLLPLFFILTLAFEAHASGGKKPKMDNEDLTPYVFDDRGVKFEPIKNPRGIVSLAPSVTEMVAALGLKNSLIGVTLWDSAITRKAKVVIGKEGTINTEIILSLEPQAVITAAITSSEDIKRMESLGLKVFLLKGEDIDEILDDLRRLGDFLNSSKRAKKLADSLSTAEKRLEECAESLSKISVFLLLDTHGGLWTAGRKTFLNDLVKRAGGDNIFSDIQGWKSVSPETVLQRNPEVIVLGWGADSMILRQSPLKRLKAVRFGKIFRCPDPDMLARPGIHSVDALRWLVKVFHPEKCE